MQNKCFLCVLLFGLILQAQNLKQQVDQLAKPLVDHNWNTGIIVGIYQKEQPNRIFSYGVTDKKSQESLNQHTIFEIGSISKVFTSIALVKMVQEGKVKFFDHINDFIDTDMKYGNTKITLQHLSTHTSALPRIPSNAKIEDPSNPYKNYTSELMDAFFKTHKLRYEPGKKYEYSNLGAGLLGRILSEKENKTYEELITSIICEPLGMEATFITIPQGKNVAKGHDPDGQETSAWNFRSLQGAGAIRSSVHDLLKFIEANVEAHQLGSKTPLQLALVAATRKQMAIAPQLDIALGWHIKDGKFRWHNGGTGGFRSFLGFDPEKQIGIVVLSNSASNVDDLAANIIRLLFGSPIKPKLIRKEIEVSSDILASYTGKYYFSFGGIDITLDNNKVSAQIAGQPAVRIYPESENTFFYKIVDAQLEFTKDKKGKVNQLILHQNGMKHIAVKLK